MVVGKVCSGRLRLVCRARHVLMLAMTLSILWRIWLTVVL